MKLVVVAALLAGCFTAVGTAGGTAMFHLQSAEQQKHTHAILRGTLLGLGLDAMLAAAILTSSGIKTSCHDCMPFGF